MKITIIGLGKLGLPMAVAYASKGHEIIGFDINEKWIARLNRFKEDPIKNDMKINEPLLKDMMFGHKDRLCFTSINENVLKDVDIAFIVVPTPSNVTGEFSNRYILDVCKDIFSDIKNRLIVLVSTVPPESCAKTIIPELNRRSGLSCGKDYFFCYSPTFPALGNVINYFHSPDYFLIGEYNKISGHKLAQFYRTIKPDRPILRHNIIDVEIAKIAIACFLTTKISFANTIANISDNIDSADPHEIMKIVGTDSRIGKAFSSPGMPYGGPCFPRDDIAMIAMANRYGMTHHMQIATSAVNVAQLPMIIHKIKKLVKPYGTITILGLAFKPDTDYIGESISIDLINELMPLRYKIRAYDPIAIPNAKKELRSWIQNLYFSLTFCKSVEEAIHKTDLVVICTRVDEFRNIGNLPVLDPWGLLK